jgi:hypothetical protein
MTSELDCADNSSRRGSCGIAKIRRMHKLLEIPALHDMRAFSVLSTLGKDIDGTVAYG